MVTSLHSVAELCRWIMAGHYDVTVTSGYNMLSVHHVIFLDICNY